MTRSNGIKCLAFLSFFVSVAASTNFTQCLIDFRNSNATEGGTDFDGNLVSDPKDAVALTYTACTDWCGDGREPFDWTVFSQQFSAWLLPWLSLVSQLPFGAESRLDNLISVALTVGSPTLAAFSLALTAINARWVNDRFSAIKYPNHRNAVKALIHLQQVPLQITTRDGLLASLIVLPENDEWWECLVERFKHTHIWTIAAATSIVWVVIAFVLTIIDSFANIGKNLSSGGQGVGSLWLWLIAIVVGWLWTPVCSYDKLRTAINKANNIAFVAAPDCLPQPDSDDIKKLPRRANDISNMQAIRVSEKTEVLTRDATRTAPVFNYARVWEWWRIAEMIARAFEQADASAGNHMPVDCGKEWLMPEDRRIAIHRDNRIGTIGQVQAYCGFPVRGEEEPMRSVPSGMWKRIFIASVFALGLQWGTTGAAAMIMILTPTTGLGCRSGSYIFYGVISTMVWLALLFSSYLAHYARMQHERGGTQRSGFNSVNFAEGLATFLRRLSTLAATCNAIWVTLVCVLQFSRFYSTCYCNSGVFGRGVQRAYKIMIPGFNNSQMKDAWIGGIVLAGGSVVLFLFFLHLTLEPPRGTHNR